MRAGHKKLSEWYLQMGQGLEAGLPLPEAMALSRLWPGWLSAEIAGQLRAGKSLGDILARHESLAPATDRFLLAAAEKSGRLPEALHKLSAMHEQARRNILKIILASLYPLFLLHFSIFLLPVLGTVSFTADCTPQFAAGQYFGRVAVLLLPLWAAVAALVIMSGRRSVVIDWLLLALPFFRGYKINQGLANFSFVLESFVSAGAPPDQGWDAAARASGDKAIARAARAIVPKIKVGQAPAEFLAAHRCFPLDFCAFYASGEKTGQLDKNLAKLGAQYQDKANRRLALAALFYPTLLFMAIAAFAAYNIIRVYASYLKVLLDVMK